MRLRVKREKRVGDVGVGLEACPNRIGVEFSTGNDIPEMGAGGDRCRERVLIGFDGVGKVRGRGVNLVEQMESIFVVT